MSKEAPTPTPQPAGKPTPNPFYLSFTSEVNPITSGALIAAVGQQLATAGP